MRELRERLAYTPTDLRRKVYILDEAHQITRDAWNALLKSLEEPPEFVTFMFASTHPQEFPPAILSRLQRFDVRRLTVPEISGKLEMILAADGREVDPEAVALVARLAAGGMRDAESILDQLLSSTSGRVEAEAVRELLGLADTETVDRFVTALAAGDAAAGIALLDELEDRGRDLRVFLDQVVDAIRDRLLAGLTSASADEGALIAAAHRLGAIDPTRLGPGGLRLQLELALPRPDRRWPSRWPAARRRAAAIQRPHAGHGRTARRVAPVAATPSDSRDRPSRTPRRPAAADGAGRAPGRGRPPPAAAEPAHAEALAASEAPAASEAQAQAETPALAEPGGPGRRPRATAPWLVRGGRDREQEPAAQAAHRVVPAHRGRGQRS